MVFLIVDTNSYDVLLGLDFLTKIEAIVDVEKGVIHVQNGPRVAVELLPLIVVNMLHPINEQQLSASFQLIKEGMHGLSLKEQLHEEDTMTHDLNDDLESDSKINGFGSEAKDDQNMILHNFELLIEDLRIRG
jgi:hypothetical protein